HVLHARNDAPLRAWKRNRKAMNPLWLAPHRDHRDRHRCRTGSPLRRRPAAPPPGPGLPPTPGRDRGPPPRRLGPGSAGGGPMTEPALFDVPDDASVLRPPKEELTRAERRHRLVASRIANGIHPLGRPVWVLLDPDSSRDKSDREIGPRCGGCRFR